MLTIRPLEAVLLAVDTAKRAGHALYSSGRLLSYGEIITADTQVRRDVIAHALDHAKHLGLPCALALEEPWGGVITTLLPLAQAVALWSDSWAFEGGSPKHVIQYQAQEWRAPLFGRSSMPRLEQRRLEQITAGSISLEFRLEHLDVPGPDASAAICMGYVVRRSAELQTKLGCELAVVRRA